MKPYRFPMQPVIVDAAGDARFRANGVVEFVMRHAGELVESRTARGGSVVEHPHAINLNILAQRFTRERHREDWEQFAQLTGYSVSGFADLSYVGTHAFNAALDAAELVQPGRWRSDANPSPIQQHESSIQREIKIAREVAKRVAEAQAARSATHTDVLSDEVLLKIATDVVALAHS